MALQRARGDGRGRPRSRRQLQTLVPRDDRLDLFVTITDFYGYDRQIADRRSAARARPAAPARADVHVRPRQARPVPAEEQRRPRLRRPRDVVLPRRLPAGQLQGVPGVGAEGRPRATCSRCFRSHILAGARPEDTQFVDGGVLDNKPFGWAIYAIQQRRADVEVDRRLLYLEPDPGDRFVRRQRQADRRAQAARDAQAAILGGRQRHAAAASRSSTTCSGRLGAQRARRPHPGRDRDELLRRGEVRRGVIGADGRASGAIRRARSSRDWTKQINEQTIAQAGLRVRDVPAAEDQRHRRPLRADGLRRLRLPRRLEPRAARARRPARVGRGAQALPAGGRADRGAARVPARARPRLRATAPPLRDVRAALVVPRPAGRKAEHPAARSSSTRARSSSTTRSTSCATSMSGDAFRR